LIYTKGHRQEHVLSIEWSRKSPAYVVHTKKKQTRWVVGQQN